MQYKVLIAAKPQPDLNPYDLPPFLPFLLRALAPVLPLELDVSPIHISVLPQSCPYLTNHQRIVSVTLVGSWLLGGAGCLGTSTQTSQHHQQNIRTSQQLQPTVLNQVSSSNKILHNSQQINQKFHSFRYNLSQS